MDIERIIDFEFIPEEYIKQIFDLLQTDDIDNWKLIYQLFIGFDNYRNLAEFYFNKMLKSYQYEHVNFNVMCKIQGFLINKEYGH